eukprot:TRINITY_DN30943_c0_g1_i2.p1 TRINITY_DN30943_c0_g1~~TRINITY_DN30943_c0_g1_i2.p1  ORF type:complete len:516 (-),score=112.79 TRINITY_DN30943_c0_g1_i2:57-1604(-)
MAAVEDSLVAQHVETYHGDDVRVAAVEGKGRVLLAARDFEAGERVLLEFPLVQVSGDGSCGEVPTLELLSRLRSEGALEYPPFFYLAALCSLTSADVAGTTGATWPTVPLQTREQICELHVPEEDCLRPSRSVESLVAALWPAEAGPDKLLLERLLQVWVYNSFDSSADGNGAPAGVVYFCASMMSHSCSPNAAWHLDDSNSFILHARSSIEEGEEITIPYLGPADLCLPIVDRRDALEATKGFRCGCPRCLTKLDPSRAFDCPRCQGAGLALPVAEPSSDEEATLVCRTCGALSTQEVADAFAAEASLRPWARTRLEHIASTPAAPATATDGASSPFDSATAALTNARKSGLAASHWIVDELRAAAASESPVVVDDQPLGPEELCRHRCELLRQRVATHEAAGPHTVTRCARLRLELASALRSLRGVQTRGASEDRLLMEEEMRELQAAADTFAILFGDDHPEHREALELRNRAARRKVSVRSAPAATEATGNAPSTAGAGRQARDKRSAGRRR